MKRWLLLGVTLATLVLSVPSKADVYAFTDAFGVRHFTDRCPRRGCKLFLKTSFSSTPPSQRSRYRSKSRSNSEVYSYYPHYSEALIGYPSLKGSNSSDVRKASVTGVRMEASRPQVINQANRKLYTPQIEQIARRYDLDPRLLHAVISAESAYDPAAMSDKGAMGLMQLMPDTARRFGVEDPFDPTANMHGGARYLRWLMNYFRNDLELVLAAYNAGEGAVERYGNAIPPYAETRTYVARVLDYYNSPRGLN